MNFALEQARNPNTNCIVLDQLSYDEDWWIREAVAYNRNTSPETLDRLANEEDWYVRYWVAKNPNTPQYIKDHFRFKNFIGNYT